MLPRLTAAPRRKLRHRSSADESRIAISHQHFTRRTDAMPLRNLEEPVPSSTAFFPQLPSLGRVAWNVRGIWNIEKVREMCPGILRTCETYDIFKRVFRGLGIQSALKCKKSGALAPYFQIINFLCLVNWKFWKSFEGKSIILYFMRFYHPAWIFPTLDMSWISDIRKSARKKGKIRVRQTQGILSNKEVLNVDRTLARQTMFHWIHIREFFPLLFEFQITSTIRFVDVKPHPTSARFF